MPGTEAKTGHDSQSCDSAKDLFPQTGSGLLFDGSRRDGFFFRGILIRDLQLDDRLLLLGGLLLFGHLHGDGLGDRDVNGGGDHNRGGGFVVDQLLGGAQDIGGVGRHRLLGQLLLVGDVIIRTGHQLPEGGIALPANGLHGALLLGKECVHQVDPVGRGGLLLGYRGVVVRFSGIGGLGRRGCLLRDGFCFGTGGFRRRLLHFLAFEGFGDGNFLHSGGFFCDFVGSLLRGDFRDILSGGVRDILCGFVSFCGIGFRGGDLLLRDGFRLGRDILCGGICCLLGGRLFGRRLCREGDGDIVHLVALHVADEGMAHLGGGLPALGRIVGTGLQDDGSHLLVGAAGGLHLLAGSQPVQPGQTALGAVKGQLAVVVDLVEHQAQGIGVHGGVQTGIGIGHLGGGIGASVAIGQGRIPQGVHGHEAQITDAVLLIAEEVDILGLQIHIQPSGLPAHSHGGAEVDAQIHRRQMGHGTPAGETLQGLAVAAEDMDLKADAVLHGNDLTVLAGHKAALLCQGVQGLHFSADALGQIFIVGQDCIGIPEDTGQQQRLHLDLGGGQRDFLNNVSFIRIVPHGRITCNAVVVRNGLAQGKTVQQGGDITWF